MTDCFLSHNDDQVSGLSAEVDVTCTTFCACQLNLFLLPDSSAADYILLVARSGFRYFMYPFRGGIGAGNACCRNRSQPAAKAAVNDCSRPKCTAVPCQAAANTE